MVKIKPKTYCVYHFPIDFEPNGIMFGSKSIEKLWIQSDLGWFNQNYKLISPGLIKKDCRYAKFWKSIDVKCFFFCNKKKYNYIVIAELFVSKTIRDYFCAKKLLSTQVFCI